jgi:hypothetical protein
MIPQLELLGQLGHMQKGGEREREREIEREREREINLIKQDFISRSDFLAAFLPSSSSS